MNKKKKNTKINKKELLPKTNQTHMFHVGDDVFVVLKADDFEAMAKGSKKVDWKSMGFGEKTKIDIERDKCYEKAFGK